MNKYAVILRDFILTGAIMGTSFTGDTYPPKPVRAKAAAKTTKPVVKTAKKETVKPVETVEETVISVSETPSQPSVQETVSPVEEKVTEEKTVNSRTWQKSSLHCTVRKSFFLKAVQSKFLQVN